MTSNAFYLLPKGSIRVRGNPRGGRPDGIYIPLDTHAGGNFFLHLAGEFPGPFSVSLLVNDNRGGGFNVLSIRDCQTIPEVEAIYKPLSLSPWPSLHEASDHWDGTVFQVDDRPNQGQVAMAKVMPYLDDDTQEIAGYKFGPCPGCNHTHYINTLHRNHSGAIWSFNGDANAPTFTPSINESVGPWPAGSPRAGQIERCHFIVTNGRIKFCDDCTHDKREQELDLPDMPPDR